MTEQIIYKREFSTNGIIMVHNTETPNQEARFAMQLAERWGLVAAECDGEDSSGRAKVRMATPSEITDRAINTANMLFAEFRARGMMLDVLPYDEAYEAAKASDGKN